jgi:hypothetical protein
VVGVLDGAADVGVLLAGPVLPGPVPTAVGLAAGELLTLPGAVLLAVADPVVLADGEGDGLCLAGPPLTPPPRVVP